MRNARPAHRSGWTELRRSARARVDGLQKLCSQSMGSTKTNAAPSRVLKQEQSSLFINPSKFSRWQSAQLNAALPKTVVSSGLGVGVPKCVLDI